MRICECAVRQSFLRQTKGWTELAVSALRGVAECVFVFGVTLKGRHGVAKGSRLGDYEVRAILGQGGMGTVYAARDHRVKRDVAIKVPCLQ